MMYMFPRSKTHAYYKICVGLACGSAAWLGGVLDTRWGACCPLVSERAACEGVSVIDASPSEGRPAAKHRQVTNGKVVPTPLVREARAGRLGPPPVRGAPLPRLPSENVSQISRISYLAVSPSLDPWRSRRCNV
jgi:hypothetical protein